MAQGTEIIPTQGGEEQAAGDTLATLLALTSDAVILLDAAGTVLLANSEALRLLGPSGVRSYQGLVGMDVRELLPTAEDPLRQGRGILGELGLSTEGSGTRLVCAGVDGRTVHVTVRCQRVDADQEAYLLVAHPDPYAAEADREHERLVEELSRANRRLAGTLDIVLGTLDSPSVSTLFERVLEELRRTMDALGTTVYLSEPDGFHLRGASASLDGTKIPRFLAANHTLAQCLVRAEHTLCLRVLPPQGDSLRKGRLALRTVVDDTSGQEIEAEAGDLPPFVSFMAVPVRFGRQVIALIEVGWRTMRTISKTDADLLDAVTRYLSVQLVGAYSALRAQRREQLATSANDLRDRLVAEPLSADTLHVLLDAVSHDLDCACAPFAEQPAIDGHSVVFLPVAREEVAVPSELLSNETGVTSLMPDAPLAQWLRDRGEPCLGAYVDGGATEGLHLRFLALRRDGSEPFDDLELEYLRQVGETVRAVSSGDQTHRRDHRISQALQSGMRSELQQVEGITAQGIYSSATEAAFVGGDFYDLIRLPNRRACVIMGDVSGKGVEAASVSAAVRTALGAYSWEGLAPSRMVRLLNEFLLGFSRVETFATLFVGIIDLARGRMAYCSAGHPPALVVRAATGELDWLGVQSGVVGAFHDMTYRDGRVRLAPGDILLLYTDGTTEARAVDGRFFGEDGLRDAVLREVPRGYEGLTDRLLAAVDAFTGNSLDDDVAMVSLRFDRVGT